MRSAPTTCDLCGLEEGRVLLRGTDRRHGTGGTFTVIRCVGCRAGRTEPRPLDFDAIYPDDSYMNHQERVDLASRLFMHTLRGTATGRWPRWRSRVMSALVPAARLGTTLVPGDRVLDVGCGSGHAVAALRAADVDAHGIEPDAGAVERAIGRGLATVRQGTLDTVALDPEAWELVRFWHTLEHTASPVANLRKAHDALVQGGRVVVGVPNLDAAARRMFGANWDGLELPRHLYHFTRASLATALQQAGFTDVRVTSVPVLGVLAGSIDAATRRSERQRAGSGMRVLQAALHPVELALATGGGGDGLLALGRRRRPDERAI